MTTQPGGPTRDLPWWHIPVWTHFGVIDPKTFVLRWPTRQELAGILWFGRRVGLVGGLGAGGTVGLAGGLAAGTTVGLVVGVVVGVAGGLAGGLALGLADMWSSPVADSAEATPRSTHRQDIQTQFVLVLVLGLGVVLALGLADVLAGVLAGVLAVGLGVVLALGLAVGLAFGLVGGVAGGLVGGAAQELSLTEVALAMRGRRVRFMQLLQTALDRQVLRQAGAVYQFRHADLQDRLSERFAAEHTTVQTPADRTDARNRAP